MSAVFLLIFVGLSEYKTQPINKFFFLFYLELGLSFIFLFVLMILKEKIKNKNENSQLNESEELFLTPLDELYFCSYLDKLMIQYNGQINLFWVKFYFIFSIITSIILIFSNRSDLSFLSFVIKLMEYFLLIFLIGLIVIVPTILFFSKKIFFQKFNGLIEAYDSKNLVLLLESYLRFNNKFEQKNLTQSEKIIDGFFKSVILYNSGENQNSINAILTIIDGIPNSIAFKYEFYNILAKNYKKLGENQLSLEFSNKSLLGFQRIKFNLSY